MTAVQTVAKNAPNLRLQRFQSLRQAQMNIQEAVIHAAQARAQRPAISLQSRFGETGHGFEAHRSCRALCAWGGFAHDCAAPLCADGTTGTDGCIGASASANCISYSRA